MLGIGRPLLLGALLAGWCCASAASGATMVATYTGKVRDGSDLTGIFGAGSDLSGLRFRMSFLYDPDTPGATRLTNNNFDVVTGGERDGTVSRSSRPA